MMLRIIDVKKTTYLASRVLEKGQQDIGAHVLVLSKLDSNFPQRLSFLSQQSSSANTLNGCKR